MLNALRSINARFNMGRPHSILPLLPSPDPSQVCVQRNSRGMILQGNVITILIKASLRLTNGHYSFIRIFLNKLKIEKFFGSSKMSNLLQQIAAIFSERTRQNFAVANFRLQNTFQHINSMQLNLLPYKLESKVRRNCLVLRADCTEPVN